MIFNTNDTPMYLLTAKKKKVLLGDCPVGMFFYKKELYIKTNEYHLSYILCYKVSSGEILKINEVSSDEFRDLKVKPVKLMDLLKPKATK